GHETRGLSLPEVGLILAALPIGSFLGTMSATRLERRLGGRRPIVATAGFGLTITLSVLVFVPVIPIVVGAMVLSGFFTFVVLPPIYATAYEYPGVRPQEVPVLVSLITT